MVGFLKAALGAAVIVFAGWQAAQAATFTSLYSFPDLTAANPAGGLYRDANGVLYGTTLGGGLDGGTASCPADGCGVVFKLVPPAPGRPNWTRKILHKFRTGEPSNVYSSLVADQDGNLYGVGQYGGANDLGAVFQLTPPPPGSTTWGFNVIHTLALPRGRYPFCDLLIDSQGRIYLTTLEGGQNGMGTVLRLNPPRPGKTAWTPTVLHHFSGTDGDGPSAGLVADANGVLYGTTWEGGTNGAGVIFRLTPPASPGGAWTFRKLHDFDGGMGGLHPSGALVLFQGALHGTTYDGGTVTGGCASGCGTIFRLKLPSTPAGPPTFRVLHRMDGANDGSQPWTGVTLGPNGSLYGANYLQGTGNQGVLFRLSRPVGGGQWPFTVLHAFGGAPDGDDPTSTLLRGSDGKFYGATQYGGANDHGMVFSYQP